MSEEKESNKETEKKRSDLGNKVFIGIKPFMNYVTAVTMQFKDHEQKEVVVSARGKFTSKAIDCCLVAQRTFLKEDDIKIKDIKISSESFETKEGKKINVSAITIVLSK